MSDALPLGLTITASGVVGKGENPDQGGVPEEEIVIREPEEPAEPQRTKEK